ncbi:hypothetical protein [Mesorhizobium sp.]|uniref:hypothetical protein n=1 Tax=Mesorhizobium sp. TaxID=1871066 RepID=UPI0011F96C7F|nr:hypothetical protein [Mesorhizobium sp.]TIL67674.1 MAG: hypothetical protein E5Y77_11465 [Mesorhizobium sp.]
MELSFAFMTRHGHQAVVRRRSYTMVQQAFAANGISPSRRCRPETTRSRQAAAAANVISLAQQKAAQTAQGGE